MCVRQLTDPESCSRSLSANFDHQLLHKRYQYILSKLSGKSLLLTTSTSFGKYMYAGYFRRKYTQHAIKMNLQPITHEHMDWRAHKSVETDLKWGQTILTAIRAHQSIS
jgi:hypothetical protein